MVKYYKHIISYGETLQSIAQDILDDSTKWYEIALFNNMNYPFIVTTEDDEIGEGVKLIGDEILIPVDETYESSVPQGEMDEIYENALGQDIAVFMRDPVGLTETEIAEFDADVYGDTKTIRGIANFKQALIMRLATPEGALLHHKDYGSRLHLLVGERGTFDTIHKIKIEVERVIRTDARTDDIKFESVSLVGDSLYLKVAIKPIGFDVAFMLSLTLGEGGLIEWA